MAKIKLWIKGHWFYLVAGALVFGAIVFGGRKLLASLAEWARKRADRRVVGDALSGLESAGDALSDARETTGGIADAVDAGVESVTTGTSGVGEALETAGSLSDGHHRIEDIVRELARRYGIDAPADF
ncbi:MAG: hypothetical protein ACQ5SW_01215 [Sphaerochaetaceae bacterium]